MTFVLLLASYVAAPVGLVLWTRWLRRVTAAPSAVTRRVYGLLTVTIASMVLLPVAWGTFGLLIVLTMDSRPRDERPSARPALEVVEHVAQALSGATGAFVLFCFVWLLYLTWRWRWSPRKDPPAFKDPYR